MSPAGSSPPSRPAIVKYNLAARRKEENKAMARIRIVICIISAVLFLLWLSPVWALDIGTLLSTCPQHDPVYSQIRSDFEIRRNGVLVQDIPCSEPISQLPISQYTDELIVVQGLRAVFYMDLGSTPLPWAPGMTLYDWMKSKMAGINISDTAGNSSCCEMLDGKRFFTLKAQDDSNRNFDRGWRGISGNIDLYAHELRHLDGFPHVSCCGISNGCDQTYDETNLSPYGIQWWLNAHWLTGALYVGFSCLAPTQINEIADWHVNAANSFRSRFCDNKPPLLMRPAMPGGQCRSLAGVIDLFILVDLSGSFFDDLPVFKAQAPGIISTLKASNPNIRFGLGKFEDYPISPFGSAAAGDKAYERLVDLTFDTDVVLNKISGLFTSDGDDEPQSQLPALFQAATGAGQDLSGIGFPEASIAAGQQANFRNGATKLFLLWTDARFHVPGDPGDIPYPGPSFRDTVNAIFALDPGKVIGISSGTDAIPDLAAIAEATGALAPAEGVDCDGDGNIDISRGMPLVCEIAPSGKGIGKAIIAIVEAATKPVNLPPDCSTAAPSVFELWPPNHKFRPISISGVTDPDGDPVTITINSIFQDEPVKGRGSGNNCPDGDGIGTDTAQVRADRAPSGDGRAYHIGFTADDGNGGTCTGKVKVCVPHNQGKKKTCVDQGSLFDSTVCQ
jgi:hypothetical protein